jgi:hypothetical protein
VLIRLFSRKRKTGRAAALVTEWSLQAYRRQAKGAQLIEHATDIRCRAERRAGELLKEMKKAQARGSNQHKERSRSATAPPTLADMGVTKTQSSRWQKLAALDNAEGCREKVGNPATRLSATTAGYLMSGTGYIIGSKLGFPIHIRVIAVSDRAGCGSPSEAGLNGIGENSGGQNMKRILFGLAALGLAPFAAMQYAPAWGDDGAAAGGNRRHKLGWNLPIHNKCLQELASCTGHYLITFAPFVFGKTPPVCVVTPLGASLSVQGLFLRVSSCEIFISNASNPVDDVFVFIASPATGNVYAD